MYLEYFLSGFGNGGSFTSLNMEGESNWEFKTLLFCMSVSKSAHWVRDVYPNSNS